MTTRTPIFQPPLCPCLKSNCCYSRTEALSRSNSNSPISEFPKNWRKTVLKFPLVIPANINLFSSCIKIQGNFKILKDKLFSNTLQHFRSSYSLQV